MAVRIAVFGAGGKVGKAIVRAVVESKEATLVAAIERPGFPYLAADAAQIAGLPAAGVCFVDERPAKGSADVWIDFSAPAATIENVEAAVATSTGIIVGTTGLSTTDKARIATAAKRIPVVLAPNMSVGVNVLLRLVTEAAATLGPGFDIEVVETHHRAKRDAPSGTALRLGEAAAEGLGRTFAAVARFERHGDVGPRTDGEIGMQTLRGGDVVGDHTVYFLGQGERIEITHRASSRETFAHGAVRAALWLAGKRPGLYDMRDVLGLK